MSSERYSETRTFRDENRRVASGNGGPYQFPNDQRVNLPIQQSIDRFNQSTNEQRLQERLRHQDTTLQWVNDPISGREKFRININVDGFNQNEVNIRVDGNKLIVFGEHFETKDQSTAKKVIEKSFELPRDIDPHSPQVTFPSSALMQVDFPSRHSNVMIDDGRISSSLISNSDSSFRTPPRLAQERSSTEYTSTRKIGGGSGGSGAIDSSFVRTSSPRTRSPYDDLYGANSSNRPSSHYQSTNYQIPVQRDYTSSSSTSHSTSSNPIYNTSSRPLFPSTSRGESGTVREQSFSETHRETEHRRSSPTSGVQSSREVEHHRSGSPSLSRTLDEDRFRTTLNIGNSGGISPATSSRNVEVREYSRRVGGGDDNTRLNLEPIGPARDFNTDAFYRSAFQPQILTDNSGQQRVEMKLDVNNYQPNEIKVSVDGNDLIVKAEHNADRAPTSSSRTYFFKQITLPPNTDFNSLSSQYHPDGRLHITAKLTPAQNSIRYN